MFLLSWFCPRLNTTDPKNSLLATTAVKETGKGKRVDKTLSRRVQRRSSTVGLIVPQPCPRMCSFVRDLEEASEARVDAARSLEISPSFSSEGRRLLSPYLHLGAIIPKAAAPPIPPLPCRYTTLLNLYRIDWRRAPRFDPCTPGYHQLNHPDPPCLRRVWSSNNSRT